MSQEYIKSSAHYAGLTAHQVEHSRSLHGRNVLTPAKRRSLWSLYMEKYQDPMIRILLAAALVSLLLSFWGGNIIETLGIIIAVLLATTVGFVFEVDASRKFDVLKSFNEDSPVKVRRDGKVMEIARQDIVVGDIVLLETGDEIPADGDLLEAISLQVNESSLTGELLCEKTVNPDSEAASPSSGFAYPQNRVYRSTMVMDGRGVMRVTEVGDSTEIGRVAKKSMETAEVETPLNRQLSKLAKQISFWGTAIAVLAFIIFVCKDITTHNHWQGYDFIRIVSTLLKYFMVSVTLIVMAVPEGLPMAITLSLALNMRRMLKSNNLVRKLHACETMGAVTVICTDKTGTLTQNKMTVKDVVMNEEFDIHDDNLSAKDLFAYGIAANTTAELGDLGVGIGNPTEVALLQWLECEGYDYKDLRRKIKIIDQLPFSTERKYMQTHVDIFGQEYTFMKGAPEIVVPSMLQEIAPYQSSGMRTLGFSINGEAHGFVAISDPLRGDVPMAVNDCLRAGVDVKIVTGDTSATAIEIAREVAIWSEDTPADCHITGADFSALSHEEALRRVVSLKVMSRARPADKQRLVELLQEAGEVVAVTGDGTNDAPALNHAHVGLSLGSGTSVAKEASDITLLDDSFASIVKAIMWGRSLYKNLQRFLFFQLVVNVAALALSVLGPFVGVELPLTVTQILWINLIMDTLAAMALSSLPPSEKVMDEKPRNQNSSIITRKMLTSIGMIACVEIVYLLAYLIYISRDGNITTSELTIFFTAFVMLQVWNMLNAKTLNSSASLFDGLRRCKGLFTVMLIILVGHWLIVQFGTDMFRTLPLKPMEWLVVIVATMPVIIFSKKLR